ncbi:MAG TPA: ACP S-malonyltransferase, partial [Pyrinomonadaceae bacterium]|nr:ACP S-malonyltransferase [Pyrinomonadaceae bacterium]
RAMQAEGFSRPDFVAGHSLGEYSALVAAGALPLKDAIRTVRARGRYMQEAVPVGAGAMAAILGADLETVNAGCNEASQGEVCSAANINSPNQVVIAGSSGAIDRAVEILKQRGAKRAMKLNVSAPFHCAMMKPAQDRLAADLEEIEFSDSEMPVVTNVDGRAVTAAGELRDSLVRQVSQPVRWLESVEFLITQGVKTFVEIGPGKVLSGLVRQIDRSVQCVNVEDEASLRAAQTVLTS